jgi:hypothetical protein
LTEYWRMRATKLDSRAEPNEGRMKFDDKEIEL